jgi:hypothetical protein
MNESALCRYKAKSEKICLFYILDQIVFHSCTPLLIFSLVNIFTDRQKSLFTQAHVLYEDFQIHYNEYKVLQQQTYHLDLYYNMYCKPKNLHLMFTR